MKIGYARVSTLDQCLDVQLEKLRAAGCEKIFSDKCSGIKEERPGLEEALAYVRQGDILVVYKLDRLGRNLKHLLDVIHDLETRQIDFESLSESLNTATPVGRLIFQIFGAIAEFERELIRERCLAGLEHARARGRIGGRPSKLNKSQVKIAKTMYKKNTMTIAEICAELEISRSTFYRHIGE